MKINSDDFYKSLINRYADITRRYLMLYTDPMEKKIMAYCFMTNPKYIKAIARIIKGHPNTESFDMVKLIRPIEDIAKKYEFGKEFTGALFVETLEALIDAEKENDSNTDNMNFIFETYQLKLVQLGYIGKKSKARIQSDLYGVQP